MSLVAFISTSVPFMVALASFATYVFMDESNTLTAKKAFVTLSYLVNIFSPILYKMTSISKYFTTCSKIASNFI